jgi:hypothetical protein
MSIGTLFTLFVTPAVYTFVARDHRAGHGGAGAHEPTAHDASIRPAQQKAAAE